MNNNLKLLFSIIALLLLSKGQCGEYLTDLTDFNDNSYVSRKYEVICYVAYDSSSDTHYFTSYQTSSKCHAIEYFKLAVTNYDTIDRRDNPTLSSILKVFADSIHDDANDLCVLRNEDKSDSRATVPKFSEISSWASTYNDYRFAFFPSISGHYEKGGSAIFTHINHNFVTYTTSCSPTSADVHLTKFSVKFAQYPSYLTFNHASNSSKFGPYFRTDPAPENMLSNDSTKFSYYQFPGIYSGTSGLYLSSGNTVESVDLSSESFASDLAGFFSSSCTDPTTSLADCGTFSSSNYYISKCYRNCTYNDSSNGKVQCTTDDSFSGSGSTITGLIPASTPFCKDSAGGRWLVLTTD